MGKYDYESTPYITINFITAIKHLFRFIEFEESEKVTLKQKLEISAKKATLKLTRYQKSIGVNMEEVELLRDVAFLGSTLVEMFENNQRIYRGVVIACIDIVEMNNNCNFSDEFVLKMMKTKHYFFCNDYNQHRFQSESFYLLFKSHFRLDKPNI